MGLFRTKENRNPQGQTCRYLVVETLDMFEFEAPFYRRDYSYFLQLVRLVPYEKRNLVQLVRLYRLEVQTLRNYFYL